MTTDELERFRRSVIKDRISSAERREHEASIDKHRALADLADLDGDEAKHEYHDAYVAAQTHQPGGHDRFMRIAARSDAEMVLSGQRSIDDFAAWERVSIRREVERILAEREAAADADLLADRPSHETASPEFDGQ